jgi:hypothetical protein
MPFNIAQNLGGRVFLPVHPFRRDLAILFVCHLAALAAEIVHTTIPAYCIRIMPRVMGFDDVSLLVC